MNALARTQADEHRLDEIDADLDLVLGAWLAVRRELRYRDDREALRGALATMKLLTNETVSAFLPAQRSGDGRMTTDSFTIMTREQIAIRARWEQEFDDGARCAFDRKYPGERETGGYPRGFHGWGRLSVATHGGPASTSAAAIAFERRPDDRPSGFLQRGRVAA